MSSAATGERVACPHADRCAGCPLINRPYGEQLERKRERLTLSASRFVTLAAATIPAVAGAEPITSYRTRAKLVVDSARVGLYARGGGHAVVDIPGCRVLTETLTAAARAVRELLAAPPADAREFVAALRTVDLREARGAAGEPPRAMVTLIAAAQPRERSVRAVVDALVASEPCISVVAVSTKDARSPRVLGGKPEVVHGPATLDDVVRSPSAHEVRVPAVPGGFVQVHRAQAERITARIGEALLARHIDVARARIVDAFAGAGAFGLALAADGAEVVLVESHAPSLEAARDAAARDGLHVRAIASDAGAALESLASEGHAPDAVIVDPPRRGLSPATRRALARLAPKLVAYVSCEPDTLCRDLDHLVRLGLAPSSLEPFDMIPLSDEVETLALLERAPAPAARVLFSTGDLVAIDKPPHEPTTPQGEWTGSLLDRVHVLPGLSHAVPLHRLDAGTSGVCLFARRREAVADWSAALSAPDAGKEYAVLARGITRDHGTIRRPLGEAGKKLDAVTRFHRDEIAGGHSLLSVRIETGRTHQIRRHLASIGHPVLGDARYGHAPSNRHLEERHALDRPFVHCRAIELTPPGGGERVRITSELPGDLETVLARLRGPR